MFHFFPYFGLYFEFVPDLTKSSLENRQVASSQTRHFLATSRVPPEILNGFCLKTRFCGGGSRTSCCPFECQCLLRTYPFQAPLKFVLVRILEGESISKNSIKNSASWGAWHVGNPVVSRFLDVFLLRKAKSIRNFLFFVGPLVARYPEKNQT